MNPLLRTLIGAAIGAAVGFLLYRFVGCKTGACPLTANPWIAIAIYGMLGALLAGGK